MIENTIIEENIIEMTRGDTMPLYFQRIDAEGNPITTIASHLWFTVKTNNERLTPVFQKTLSDMTFDEDGVYHFRINPNDTNGLEYGDYIYDVEVIQSDYKQTISKGIFRLTWESTFVNNEVE